MVVLTMMFLSDKPLNPKYFKTISHTLETSKDLFHGYDDNLSNKYQAVLREKKIRNTPTRTFAAVLIIDICRSEIKHGSGL